MFNTWRNYFSEKFEEDENKEKYKKLKKKMKSRRHYQKSATKHGRKIYTSLVEGKLRKVLHSDQIIDKRMIIKNIL